MKATKQVNRYFSSVFSNFDIRIVIVFLVVLLVGVVIWIIKVQDYVECSDAKFYVIGEQFSVNEVITFNNQTPNAKTWEWDFGDGSEKETRQQVLHKYDKAGTYIVKLRINGSCELEQSIEIKNLGALVNQQKIPEIISPTIVQVGEPVYFDYEYNGEAFSWEWSFGESGQMDSTEPQPYYVYQTPGTKSVTLIINGDVKHIANKTVYVKPRAKISRTFEDPLPKSYVYEKDPNAFSLEPGDPMKDPMEEYLEQIPLRPQQKSKEKDSIPPLEIAPNISEDQFELLLMQVANQSKTKDDFGKYTCGDFDIPVVVNKEKLITFTEFCKKIKGKEIKIEAIRLTKDNLNCVDGITINYKVRKFLRWAKDDLD